MAGRVPVATTEELSTYYTPGVAYPCLAIKDNSEKSFDYTLRGRTAAIISDGTRVLGLGKIGPEAGMPVMEGKSVLFKTFAGVDAIPVCLSAHGEDEIVRIVEAMEPTFGAVNIEDIETPKCLNIVARLRSSMGIPVFHDDSEGVAIVTLAGLINALKLAGKAMGEAKIVINGAGAAGIGIARLLARAGAENMVLVDTAGALYKGRAERMNGAKEEIAAETNPRMEKGTLQELARGADVLIGVSARGAFTAEMVKSMAGKPIVFALANPEPEIDYEEAKAAGAFIVATGRSDRPNQVNNLLAFPGMIRGLLETRPTRAEPEMSIAAAKAIARFVGRKAGVDMIVPDPTDRKAAMTLAAKVAGAVARTAVDMGIATVRKDPGAVEADTKRDVKNYARYEARMLKKQGAGA
jgi:malate dehydrogenase (oxaloacetate-decarboxylating)